MNPSTSRIKIRHLFFCDCKTIAPVLNLTCKNANMWPNNGICLTKKTKSLALFGWANIVRRGYFMANSTFLCLVILFHSFSVLNNEQVNEEKPNFVMQAVLRLWHSSTCYEIEVSNLRHVLRQVRWAYRFRSGKSFEIHWKYLFWIHVAFNRVSGPVDCCSSKLINWLTLGGQ